jgi:hypothetical protein
MLEWIGFGLLLGLTGNWRGYRMGGKAIGGSNMSTDIKKKFEQARASGNMDQAKTIADKAQKAKEDKKAEKSNVPVGSIVALRSKSSSGFTSGDVIVPVKNKGGKGYLGEKRQGQIKGDWIAEKDGTVTHIATGLRLVKANGLKAAKAAVDDVIAAKVSFPSKTAKSPDMAMRGAPPEQIQALVDIAKKYTLNTK